MSLPWLLEAISPTFEVNDLNVLSLEELEKLKLGEVELVEGIWCQKGIHKKHIFFCCSSSSSSSSCCCCCCRVVVVVVVVAVAVAVVFFLFLLLCLHLKLRGWICLCTHSWIAWEWFIKASLWLMLMWGNVECFLRVGRVAGCWFSRIDF